MNKERLPLYICITSLVLALMTIISLPFTFILLADLRFWTLLFAILLAGISFYVFTQQTRKTIASLTDQLHEHQLTSSLSAALRTAATRMELVQSLLNQLTTLIDGTGTALVLREPMQDEGRLEVITGDWGEVNPSVLFSDIIQSGQPMTSSQPHRAIAVVPLILRDQVIGALGATRSVMFTPAQIRLLKTVATIAANATHRASLTERNQQYLVQMARAAKLGISLNEPINQGELFQRVTNAITALFQDVTYISLSTLTQEFNQLSCVYSFTDGQPAEPGSLPTSTCSITATPALSELIEGHSPKIVNDPGSLLQYPDAVWIFAGKGTHCALLAPLWARGQFKGVLVIASPQRSHFQNIDSELVSLVASITALSLDNIERCRPDTHLPKRHQDTKDTPCSQ